MVLRRLRTLFRGQDKLNGYSKKQDARNEKWNDLEKFNKREGEAKKDGKDPGFSEDEKRTIEELRGNVGEMDREMDGLRAEAKRRGDDEKARREETESWDSIHIWYYAPKNDG
jgi:hypothetical protein